MTPRERREQDWTGPNPTVLEAVARLARDLQDIDADEAWTRLVHVTLAQRAQVQRAVGDAVAKAQAPDG